MKHKIAIAVDSDDDGLPYQIEALSEGLVRMAIDEIERSADPDAFPCCCQCGGFAIAGLRRSTAYKPAMGYVPPSHVYRTKKGDPLSLCVYQAAQARREGKAARVVCDWGDASGFVVPVVEIDGEIKDIAAELAAQECGCAGEA